MYGGSHALARKRATAKWFLKNLFFIRVKFLAVQLNDEMFRYCRKVHSIG